MTFKSFVSTVNPFQVREWVRPIRILVDPFTGAPAGIQTNSASGPDGIWTPVDLTAGQIASPSAGMIADINAMYRLNVAPYTRYISNGTTLVAAAGSGGSGSPGGSDTQIQRNNAGAFGAVSGVTSSDGIAMMFATAALLLAGSGSGQVTLNAPATGGGTVTLPAGSVTLAPTASPAFTTPSLGVASATSINKVAITAPATSATLTIADGKTLTASNTVTLTATDGSTLAIGTGGTLGTAAYTASSSYAVLTANTFTGDQTLSSCSLILSGNQSAAAWTTSGIRLKGVAATLTDTSSSGTVAAAYDSVLGGNTIAASSSTTFTKYASFNIKAPIAGTNVVITSKIALQTDNVVIGSGVLGSDTLVVTGTMSTSDTAVFAGDTLRARQSVGLQVFNTGVMGFTATSSSSGSLDTAQSRLSAGITAFGTGAQGSVAGKIQALAAGLGAAASAAASLVIAAGTTAIAQINFGASTAPTSPNDGDYWFDGTNVKIRVGGSTKTFTIV